MFLEMEQNSAEWLQVRKGKRTASETPNVMGVGFLKPYQFALQKYGESSRPAYMTSAMCRGHDYEPQIRKKLEKETGAKLEPKVVLWDDDPRYLASLDGFDVFKNVIAEIKFSGDEFMHVKQFGAPSEKYFYQVQHQLAVTGADVCYFCAGRIGKDFELETVTALVKPDPRAWDEIRQKWDEFEADYKDMPLDDEWAQMATELREINSQIKALEARGKALKDKAIAKANGKEIKAQGLTVYKIEKKGGYDYGAFLKDKNIKIDDKYLKPHKINWGVRVNDE